MVRAGLVQRQEDPNDRRGCRVRLTAEGLQLIDRLAPVHQALCDEVGDILEAVDGRRIVELLDSLREGIRARLRP
jgi:DNA-binding MarR family transcriptional regulator